MPLTVMTIEIGQSGSQAAGTADRSIGGRKDVPRAAVGMTTRHDAGDISDD